MNPARLVLVAAMALTVDRPHAIRIETATANDNAKPAGRVDGTTLSVSLELREAVWHPGGDAAEGLKRRVEALGK